MSLSMLHGHAIFQNFGVSDTRTRVGHSDTSGHVDLGSTRVPRVSSGKMGQKLKFFDVIITLAVLDASTWQIF